MTPVDRLAQAADSLCSAVLDAPKMPLQERVEALFVSLATFVEAGLTLPCVAPVAAPGPAPGAAAFPGLGTFDAALRLNAALDPGANVAAEQTSATVLAVAACAWSGLEAWQAGDADTAVDRWAASWPRWSSDALFALTVLNEARLRLRPVPEKRRSAHVLPIALTAAPQRGWLGLRFEPLGLGVLIREVAEGSPAQGLIEAGDVLLSVDDAPLDALDPAEIARVLVPRVGESRTVEVYRDGATRDVALVGAIQPTNRGTP